VYKDLVLTKYYSHLRASAPIPSGAVCGDVPLNLACRKRSPWVVLPDPSAASMADAALLLTLEPATRLRASAAVLLGATLLRGSEE
jgi:hypothetical protein